MKGHWEGGKDGRKSFRENEREGRNESPGNGKKN